MVLGVSKIGSSGNATLRASGSSGVQGSGAPGSRWVLQSWLENIQFSFYPPCMNLREDLRIRALLKREKEEFRRRNPYDLKILGGSPTCVIETVRDVMGLPGDREDKVGLEQESVLATLLLYRDRLVTRNSTFWKEGDFVTADERQEYDLSWAEPLWRMFVAAHHRFPLELGNEDKDEFKNFWGKLERSEKKVPQLSRCLGRFLSASGMVTEAGMEIYRFVDYITSMEALLTERRDPSLRLSLRMALLLGRSAQETAVAFEFMKLVYNLRSRLVHGDELPLIKLRDVDIRAEEALGRLHSYCRDCIRHSLDLVDAGFDSKEKLLRLIDLAILRTDMHASLWAFLGGKQSAEKLKDDFNQFDKLVFHPVLHEERHGALE
jgi:hypothetical protein